MGIALSPEQREQFESNGYLLVPGALGAQQVEELLAASLRLYRNENGDDGANRSSVGEWWSLFHPTSDARQAEGVHRWETRNVVVQDPSFLELIDEPSVFPLVLDMLNENIFLMGSHLMVRHRAPLSAEELARTPLGWHRDVGTSPLDMAEPHPRISVKVAYWLTALSGPGQGAMRVVPGSHRLIGKPAVDPATNQPYGAIEILAEPGDALIFEQRLWHAGAPNTSDQPRICLFFAYGYRWLRPQDYREMPPALLERVSPVRRQLLGATETLTGYHLPTPADVPLRAWVAAYPDG